MIELGHPRLSIRRQCELIGLNRASFYYEPVGESALNLELMRLIDEEDLFTVYAASGLVAQLGGQAFINILVNLQLFPSKGMTLPLISYGGSSTMAICLGVGLLLAITRRNPFLRREKLSLKQLGLVK